MKLNAVVVKSLLMAASIGLVGPLIAQTPPKPTPGTPQKEKAEPVPKIAGITIPRADGRFLGLTVEGVQFNLRFYNAKKKPEKPDAARAAARWNPVNVKAELRAILNPSGNGMTLVSPGLVRPPLTFRTFFTLFAEDGQVMDTFSVDLNDLTPMAAPAPVAGADTKGY